MNNLPSSAKSSVGNRGCFWVVRGRLVMFLLILMGFCASVAILHAADPLENGLPKGQPTVLEAADQAYSEGRFQEAIRLYTDAAKAGAQQARAFLGRGMAREMLNQQDKAAEDYKRVLEADPKNYKAMENLAGIWERTGQHVSEAVELYRRALKLDPRPAWKENLEVWIGILQTRLRPEESSAVACWHKGNAKALQGAVDAAEAAYSKAIALNRDMFQAYYSRGLVRMKEGDLAAAVKDFDETIRLSPRLRGGYVHRGLVYEQLGDFRKALDDFTQAADVDPRDPHAFYQMGRMLEQSGNLEAALQVYQDAMLLKPKPDLLKVISERTSAVCAAGNLDRNKAPVGSKNRKELW